jgi:hypothetical protein
VIWVCFLFRFHRTKSLFYVNKATDE